MNARRLARNIFIFVLWSWLFLYWLRFFLFRNWFFDFAWANDWAYLWHEWTSGWVIYSASDWTFIFTIFAAIPLWLIGFLLLISVKWGETAKKIVSKAFSLKKKEEKKKEKVPFIAKTPSHKTKRPPALNIGEIQQRVLEQEDEDSSFPSDREDKPVLSSQEAKEKKEPGSYEEFLSSLNKPQTEEKGGKQKGDSFFDDDFDPSIPESRLLPDPSQNGPGRSVSDVTDSAGLNMTAPAKHIENEKPDLTPILEEKGYRVLTDVLVDGSRIDYVGISEQKVVLCQIDKEPGDWLADEEQFNNDDPLWFSESSHRTSPVFELKKKQESLLSKLAAANLSLEILPVLVMNFGEIINSEDMLETWQSMKILVASFKPDPAEELPLFKDILPQAGEAAGEEKAEQIGKILRG